MQEPRPTTPENFGTLPWVTEAQRTERLSNEELLTSNAGDFLTFEFEDKPEKLGLLVVARGEDSEGSYLSVAPLTTSDTLPGSTDPIFRRKLKELFEDDEAPRAATLRLTPEGQVQFVIPRKGWRETSESLDLFGSTTDGEAVVTIKPYTMGKTMTPQERQNAYNRTEAAAKQKAIEESLKQTYAQFTEMERDQVVDLLREMDIRAQLSEDRIPDFRSNLTNGFEERNPTAYELWGFVSYHLNKTKLLEEGYFDNLEADLERFRQMEQVSYQDSFDLPKLMFLYRLKQNLDHRIAGINVKTPMDPNLVLPPAVISRYTHNIDAETVPVPNLDLERRQQALNELALRTMRALTTAEHHNAAADALFWGGVASLFTSICLTFNMPEVPNLCCGMAIFGFLASGAIHKNEYAIKEQGRKAREEMTDAWTDGDIRSALQDIQAFVRQATNTSSQQVTIGALRRNI